MKDLEKGRFEGDLAVAGVVLAGNTPPVLRDLVSLRDSFSIKSPKTAEARTSPITELVPHRSALTLSAIVSSKPIDSPQGDVFPSISTSGNFKDVITDAEFVRACEMKDERVDLIINMQRNKYDWSKHVWAYKETVKPFQYSSEEDGSDEKAAVETSETEIEEEIESIRVSPTKKRKSRFRDTGAESRKKRLLCQRSTEKYRDLEEEMKSYIQSMFNSSFTALGLEVREIIEDRFTKLEEKILSSQTQGGAPANTQTRGTDPFWTPSAAAAGAAAAATAPASVSGRPPAPTRASTEAPASVSTPGLAPSRSAASAPYRSRASATAHNGGPANAAKTRSQTKDADLSDVFGSLFSTLDVNIGTQKYLQKTMGNLTQESNVDGFDPSQDKQSEGPSDFTTPMTSFRPQIFKTPFLIDSDDIEVRCKAKDYELVFLPEEKWAKLTEWTLNPTVLQIGPSTFDAELASRIIGPNIWLKNFDMDAMMYLFREKTTLRRWSPDRVAFLNCMFSNQIITAYGNRPTRKLLKPDPEPGSTHPQRRDFLFSCRNLRK
ncbi:hypothetical protein IGI04_023513 [Brassica rapa subsp. trilocularis]|uniref:Uncharacterized protein n=1 Tax=Brassica rapa subsp. trilocularis TaxID=1813537 RepID=A0ABQ7M6N0_BRACM|nr:hypothetical protein IGI04_023513 [Brassica rapa subsp. trilocularis]